MKQRNKQRQNYPVSTPVDAVIPTYEQLRQAYPMMADFNTDLDLSLIPKDATFLVLRSASLDNILKGMKYGVWTSTSKSNSRINSLIKEQKEVYAIYSVVGSRAFQAVAKIISEFDRETFQYWDDPCKWFGSFKIQCIFLAELKQQILDEKQPASLGTIILTDQTDCTEINNDLGVFVIQCFKSILEEPNLIVAQFPNVDAREAQIRQERDNDPNYQQQYFQQLQIFTAAPFEYRNQQRRQNHWRHMQRQAEKLMYYHAYNSQYYSQQQYQQPNQGDYYPQHQHQGYYPHYQQQQQYHTQQHHQYQQNQHYQQKQHYNNYNNNSNQNEHRYQNKRQYVQKQQHQEEQ